MAARLTCLSMNAFKKQFLQPQKLQKLKPIVQRRTMIYNEAGAIISEPEITKLGAVKVLAVVIPFITLGGYISREFAALLEEHEIFFPDDDDD